MPSLTLFRTYLVQVYNIMRNVTTFLKVIFVHFSKDNETVSFIKLLDFGLSQGRVSAASIKCVVICSKFITFAVTKTIKISRTKQDNSCDLIKIHYLCGDKDNGMKAFIILAEVVICSKFITFAVTKTMQ